MCSSDLNDLFEYVSHHFEGHLTATTSGFCHISDESHDDHPALKFFHDLETRAYYVDKSLSSPLSRSIIGSILRWAENVIIGIDLKVVHQFTVVLLF